MAEKQLQFRRIRGRIVPVGRKDRKPGDRARVVAASSAGVLGAGVAADAAQTSRIYQKGTVTIDRKRFAIQPVMITRELVSRKQTLKVGGKRAAVAFYKGVDKDAFTYRWLSVNRRFRGKGYSKVLSASVAREMKADGFKSQWSNVVHPKSLTTNYSPKRDMLWKYERTNKKTGQITWGQLTKTEAMRNIRYWRDKRGMTTSNVFRETSLKGVHRSRFKPFRTMGNKLKIAAGLGLLAASAAYLYRNRKK